MSFASRPVIVAMLGALGIACGARSALDVPPGADAPRDAGGPACVSEPRACAGSASDCRDVFQAECAACGPPAPVVVVPSHGGYHRLRLAELHEHGLTAYVQSMSGTPEVDELTQVYATRWNGAPRAAPIVMPHPLPGGGGAGLLHWLPDPRWLVGSGFTFVRYDPARAEFDSVGVRGIVDERAEPVGDRFLRFTGGAAGPSTEIAWLDASGALMAGPMRHDHTEPSNWGPIECPRAPPSIRALPLLVRRVDGGAAAFCPGDRGRLLVGHVEPDADVRLLEDSGLEPLDDEARDAMIVLDFRRTPDGFDVIFSHAVDSTHRLALAHFDGHGRLRRREPTTLDLEIVFPASGFEPSVAPPGDAPSEIEVAYLRPQRNPFDEAPAELVVARVDANTGAVIASRDIAQLASHRLLDEAGGPQLHLRRDAAGLALIYQDIQDPRAPEPYERRVVLLARICPL